MPKQSKKHFYISMDIEADGPIPADYSMLQIGAVFYDDDGKEIGRFSANLDTLPGAKQHPDTMEFWALQEKKRPGTWARMRSNLVDPAVAMQDFTAMVKRLSVEQDASPVVVGYPVTFDFQFVFWYLHHFTGDSIVGFAGYDMKSVASEILGMSFRDSTKGNFPRTWFPPVKRKTHVAVEDAEDQGFMFWAIRKAATKLRNEATSGRREIDRNARILENVFNLVEPFE